MNYTPDKIRNVAVVGHQGSGKTSLVESLAYVSGLIEKKGSIETKDTISDFKTDEKKKQISISSSIVPIFYGDYKVNLIDIPGNDDFIFETIGVTRLVKGAILVIDASKGVQNGTIKNFNLLKKRGVPIFIYLNKMDKEDVKFNDLYEEICAKLDPKKCVPFTYPIGKTQNFDGFVNVVELKARKYNGTTCVDDVIYDDKKPLILELHNRLVEAVAATSDEILEKFFAGEPLTNEEIKSGLRAGVLNGDLYPIIVGSATKNIGIHTLLEMLCDYLPAPNDLKPYQAATASGELVDIKTDENEKVSLQIFKNTYNTYQGLVSVFKVQSGTVHVGDELISLNNNKTYRIGSLFSICGEKLSTVSSVSAGDIGAVTKLEDITLSMTLSDRTRPVVFKKVNYPTPTYFKSIVPETKKDIDKLFTSMDRFMLEDPTIALRKDETTGQIVIGGLSSSHLSYILERLESEFQIKFTLEPLKISYREAITEAAESEGRFVKQSGGAGYYGIVVMRFEPSEECSFESRVFGGHIDKGYFPAVEKGFMESLESGGLIGAPVIHCKAILLDGKQHPVDSNEMAFKSAAQLAFKSAYMKCKPMLLEPYDKIIINIPNEFLGAVLSDLTKRRAKINSTDDVYGGNVEVTAIVPESEIMEYTQELKSLSRGIGFYSSSFESYEAVPQALADKIISANKK